MELSYSSLHSMRSILAAAISDHGLVCVDSTPMLYRYSPEGTFLKHSPLKGVQSYPSRYGKSISLTNNAQFGLVCDFENDRVLFLSLEPLKFLSMIPFPKPNLAVFSGDNRYFVLGSGTGKIKLYEIFECKSIAEVHLADAVVCTAFSKDNTHLAIATMDKKVHVFHIGSGKIIYTFRLESIAEALTFSTDNTKIVCFTRTGATFVFNLVLKQQLLGDPIVEWPTHIVSGESQNIVLIGSRSNHLFIYNNADGAKLGSIRFDYWGITALHASLERVFVGFSDGNGHIIDLKNTIQEAISALQNSNISALCVLILENPLILINPTLCTTIKESHKTIFDFRPSNAEERRGYEIIISLMIAEGGVRKELIQTLYTSTEIAPFMEEISNGNLQKACTKVYKTPLLRQLREFNEVRSGCLSELSKEVKLLETDPEKFKEYIDSTPPRCAGCVHNIIPAPEVLAENYQKLLSSASAKNYAAVLEITDHYPALRQTKIYRRLMSYGESLIDKTRMLIAEGKIDEADLYATKLSQIKPFALSGLDFKNQIKAYDAFENAAKSNNLVKLFSMAIEFPALRTTEIFRDQLEKYQKNILLPAHPLIQHGEVVKLLSLIEPYRCIEFFEEKNQMLIKKALIHEIRLYAPFGQEQELLDHYHECFGWDQEYGTICDTLSCTAHRDPKLEPLSEECKKITTFLTGEKILRELKTAS